MLIKEVKLQIFTLTVFLRSNYYFSSCNYLPDQVVTVKFAFSVKMPQNDVLIIMQELNTSGIYLHYLTTRFFQHEL